MKKLKPRRSKVKHASLKKNYNSKIRQEYVDIDYVDKLDDKVANCKLPNGKMVTQKEYMSLFMNEWNNAEVGSQDNASENLFLTTKELVKETTDRNNKRNNDLWGQSKAMNRGYVILPNELKEYIDKSRGMNGINDIEDALIDLLDHAEDLKKSTDNTEE